MGQENLMLVTDLDFTVLRSDHSISPYTQSVFARCACHGIATGVATARYRLGAKQPLAVLHPEYEITTDGAMIHHRGHLLHGWPFSPPEANGIIAALKSFSPAADISAATEAAVFWNKADRPASSILFDARYTDYSVPFTEPVYKLVAELPSQRAAQSIADDYHCTLVSYRGENRYGFLRKEAGKMNAIRVLAAHLKIPLQAVVAFGDDENDREMLAACGTGVAVSNAISAVKSIADAICPTNDEDGVAHWIEENLFLHNTTERRQIP